MKKDEVVFFGVTYTVAELEEAYAVCERVGPPLGLSADGFHRDVSWNASTLGALYDLDPVGEGKTPRAAAKDLERQILKLFRQVGKAIGYVVE